jgi:hypothetical protein
MKAEKYLKNSWKNFIETFRSLDKSILHIVLYDLAFYIVCFILFYKFRDIIVSKGQEIVGLDLSTAVLKSVEVAGVQVEVVKSFYNTLLFCTVLFAAIAALAYILSNLLIWSTIAGKKLKKLNKRFVGYFFLMNIIWVIAWGVLFFIVATGMRPELVPRWALIFTVIYSHLTALMYIAYFKRAKAGRAVKTAFNTGFAKIHNFIVPYFFAAAVFVAINIILKAFDTLPPKTFMFISTITALFYFAWLRIYVYSFARDLV